MAIRPRILIVDDEALLVRSLTRMLTRAGYEVVARLTLATAGEALRAEPIDVVLTDLRIGDGSGIELIRIAGELAPTPGVIVFSGSANADEVEAAIQAGARTIIRKPVQPADLLAAVAAVAGVEPEPEP